MVVILGNQNRVARIRMFVPAVRHQYHRADFSRTSPEFREQLAAHVDVFFPLVVLHARRMCDRAPVEHRVHFGQFFFERRNLVVERNANRAGCFGIEMQLLRRAQEISGLRLPVLAFALVRRKLHHLAVAQVKSFVNVEHGPHRVFAGNQFAQALERIAKRGRIHAHHGARLPRVHIHSKRLLRLEAFLHSEACCDGHIAFRDDQQDVAVHRRCRQLLRVRNLEHQRLWRTSQRSKRRRKQN